MNRTDRSARTFRDAVAEWFKARPNTWIDGMELSHVGGCYASRTRISECRTQLGMRIENRVRWHDEELNDYRVSEYRYVPVDGQGKRFRNNSGRAA